MRKGYTIVMDKQMRRKVKALVRPYVNREHKDTVFRMLFIDKENLLKLYNAVNGTDYTDVYDLVIVTLESAIYLGYKNDTAFLIGDFLNLYEHQSTYNPNIPLRMLLYVASEYQVLMKDRALYTSTIQKIPTPRFVVFYNGQDKKVEKEVLKLSDSFVVPMEEPELEVKVTLYNINKGHNRELMKQCKLLGEYASYVATVRKYAKIMPVKEAVNRAVDYCIGHGILADFLRENRMKVVKMSIFEYDEEREKMLEKAEMDRVVAEERRLREEAEKRAEENIRKMVSTLKECDIPEDIIKQKLMEKYLFTEMKAERYLEKSTK